MLTSAKSFYERNSRWIPIAFFVAGFVFDAMILHRIDEWLTIVQQAVYLAISAVLIGIELLERPEAVASPPASAVRRFWIRVWSYRESLLHFLLGTLLNAYTIFYFKSASAITSFTFIVLLALILLVNEFKRFSERQTQVHAAILSLCLISYLVLLMPILFGFLGIVPFIVAHAAAALLVVMYHATLRSSGVLLSRLRRDLVMPFAAVQILFIAMYFLRVIPPVPLSISYMGVFHAVEKEGSSYVLSYVKGESYFWEHGAKEFRARPGDVVHCFIRVFAPARFKDELKVRWLFKDAKRGWVPSDAIPLAISGGREEGFRGVTKKANYQPGDWRVSVETADGREVGRYNFEIVAESVDAAAGETATGERKMEVELQ